MNKQILTALAGGAFMFTVGTASADDNFAGIYAGADLGYGIVDVDGVYDNGENEYYQRLDRVNLDGFNLGLHAGINFQQGHLVYGGVADVIWLLNSDDTVVDADNDLHRVESEFIASVRGKLGMASDGMMVYVTAGVAWTSMDLKVTENGENTLHKVSIDPVGLVIGGGVELARWDNFLIRAEYLHYSFGNHKNIPDGGNNNDADDGDFFGTDGHDVFRVGASMKFDLFGRRGEEEEDETYK